MANTSLRDLAEAAGVSHRTLLYHFGSREALMLEALRALRDRQYSLIEQARTDQADQSRAFDLLRGIWKHISADEADDSWKLFFEAYAAAIRSPETDREYLDGVVHRWIGMIEDTFTQERPGLAENDSATLVLAAMRGLQLDLLATGDHARIDRAFETLLALLERNPRAKEHVTETARSPGRQKGDRDR